MRLLLVSGGIMVAGLIAVFVAIVYKINEGGRAADSTASRLSTNMAAEGEIRIPPGHRLIGATLDGNRALLTLEAPDGSSLLLVVDLATGSELARRRLLEE